MWKLSGKEEKNVENGACHHKFLDTREKIVYYRFVIITKLKRKQYRRSDSYEKI